MKPLVLAATLSSLYYALQLKDVGCSSNAARMAQLFGGDDRNAKAVTKLTDWTGLMNGAAGHQSLRERVADFAAGLKAAPRNARFGTFTMRRTDTSSAGFAMARRYAIASRISRRS